MITFKRRVCALILAVLMLAALSACGGEQPPPSGSTSASPAPAVTASPFWAATDALMTGYSGTQETDSEAELLSLTASVTEEQALAISAAGEAMITEYPYYALMGFESSMARYLETPEYEKAGQLCPIEEILLEPAELFELVKLNNAVYVDEGGLYGTNELDDDYLMQVCEIVSETLAQELPALYGTMIPIEVRDNFRDLKIYKNVILMSNAYVTTEACMYINTSHVDFSADDGVAAKKTIAHETEHLIQHRSVAAMSAMGIERGIGFDAMWLDEPVNSMFYYWFIEAAAEKLSSSLYGGEPLTYFTMVQYLDFLSLFNILKGGEAKDVPRLSQQTSLQKLFDTLGCTSEEAQKELLGMFYAIEILNDFGDGFYAQYEAAYGEALSGEAILELKAAILRTLGKYFYQSLVEFSADNHASLREIFLIITTFELNLSDIFRYSSENNVAALAPALRDYAELQSLYLGALGEDLGLTADDIYALFEASHCRAYVPRDSLLHGKEDWTADPVTALSDESNSFMSEFYFDAAHRKAVPVRAVLEIMSEGG